MDKNKAGKMGLLFIGGVAAGYLAKKMVDSEGFKKKRAEVMKALGEAVDKDRIKKVFGDTKEEMVASYQTAKSKLVDGVSKTKGAIGELDKGKYQGIVNEVVESLKNTGKYTAEQLKLLKDYFMDDFSKIKSQALTQNGGNGKAESTSVYKSGPEEASKESN